jgi:hypothetical protein
MSNDGFDLPDDPIRSMQAVDMDGRPSSALMALFRLASDIPVEIQNHIVTAGGIADELRALNASLAALIELQRKLPRETAVTLSNLYKKVADEKAPDLNKAYALAQEAFKAAAQLSIESKVALEDMKAQLVPEAHGGQIHYLAAKIDHSILQNHGVIVAANELTSAYADLATSTNALTTEAKKLLTQNTVLIRERHTVFNNSLWTIFRAWLAWRFTAQTRPRRVTGASSAPGIQR